MADRRPRIASALVAFGVDATVTPPGGPSVEARVIWLAPRTVEVPIGNDNTRAEIRRIMAIPISDVPNVPRETIVSAPEAAGEATRNWRVDAAERVDYDHHRVMVIPA